jgi:hypothetical protein
VDIRRLFAQPPIRAGGTLVLATGLCGLLLLAWPARAARPGVAGAESPGGPGSGTPPLLPRPDAEAITDVAVRPDGSLRGRVVGGPAGCEMNGLRVKVVRDRWTVAVTVTGRAGEFSVRNLPDGLYCVAVDGGRRGWRFCRVWRWSSAPPGARGELNVPAGGPLVRGQSLKSFPMASLPQAATVAVFAAGAIAAPVIYHNTLMQNRIPASP